jgi:hypothetical protein
LRLSERIFALEKERDDALRAYSTATELRMNTSKEENDLRRGLRTRTNELESALRGLIERVERVGGYATTDDQLALWRAKQALHAKSMDDPEMSHSKHGMIEASRTPGGNITIDTTHTVGGLIRNLGLRPWVEIERADLKDAIDALTDMLPRSA